MTPSIATPPMLMSVPNVSEGRDEATIARIGAAFAAQLPSGGPANDVRLLDVHSDADHHRSVFTLAGLAPQLADALLRGAAAAVAEIDVVARAHGDAAQAGAHPHVGAIDVVPLVYIDPSARGAACAEALIVADRIASELDVPVFVYGELAGGRPGATRAELRRGGLDGLARRIAGADGQPPLRPDFGPPRLHPSAGATLLAAREPLVAFNLQLAPPADIAEARRIAALIREGGKRAMPGLRAIGVALSGGVAQVSMNVERPFELALAEIVGAVASLAPVESAELVGLAPRAALDGFPPELPIAGFDPERHVIETALSANGLDVAPRDASANAPGDNALGS
jgi:glutamate formiminotransferase/glutamate formiminotransferase/formiminotetrahydrofolate cyclodeaminase